MQNDPERQLARFCSICAALFVVNPSAAIECPPDGNYKIILERTTSNIWLKWNQDNAVKCEKVENKFNCGGKTFSDDFGAIYPKSSFKSYYPTSRIGTRILVQNNCVKEGEYFSLINKWTTDYAVDKTYNSFTIFVEMLELRRIKHIKF